MSPDPDISVIITRFSKDRLLNASRKFNQFPYRTRINGVNFYVINITNGYKVFIKVDSRNQPDSLTPLTLRDKSPVRFVEYEGFESSLELKMLKPHLSKIKRYRSK
jgi:hypothetical protein